MDTFSSRSNKLLNSVVTPIKNAWDALPTIPTPAPYVPNPNADLLDPWGSPAGGMSKAGADTRQSTAYPLNAVSSPVVAYPRSDTTTPSNPASVKTASATAITPPMVSNNLGTDGTPLGQAPKGMYIDSQGRLQLNGTGEQAPVDTTANPRTAAPAYTPEKQDVIDEAAIRKAEEERVAAQIRAIEGIYAGEIIKAQRQGNERLGQKGAMSTVRGGAGSDFAAAGKDKVVEYNNQIEDAINAEKAAKIAAAQSDGSKAAREAVKDAYENAARKRAAADAFMEAENKKFADAETKATSLSQAGIDYGNLDETTRSLLESKYGSVANAEAQYKKMGEKSLEKPTTVGSAEAGYYQYGADGKWTQVVPPTAGNKTSIQNIGGREVLIAYDSNGKVLSRTDLGVSGSGSGSGTKEDPAQEAWQDDVNASIIKLAEGEKVDPATGKKGSDNWGTVWNALYSKYRSAGVTPEQIDNALNKDMYYPQEGESKGNIITNFFK